jgi:hypothetical protein
MIWKRIGIVSLLLILPVVAKWLYDSNDYGKILIFSQDQKIIEKKSFDELFGTETIQNKTQEGFWFGLLPIEDEVSLIAIVSVMPMSGILVGISFISFIIYRKKIKILKQDNTDNTEN